MQEQESSSDNPNKSIQDYFRRRIPQDSFVIAEGVSRRYLLDSHQAQALGLFFGYKTVEIETIEREWMLLDGDENFMTDTYRRKAEEARQRLSDSSKKIQEFLDKNPLLASAYRQLERDYEKAYTLGSVGIDDRVGRTEFMKDLLASCSPVLVGLTSNILG